MIQVILVIIASIVLLSILPEMSLFICIITGMLLLGCCLIYG
jgi:hypothetical protein